MKFEFCYLFELKWHFFRCLLANPRNEKYITMNNIAWSMNDVTDSVCHQISKIIARLTNTRISFICILSKWFQYFSLKFALWNAAVKAYCWRWNLVSLTMLKQIIGNITVPLSPVASLKFPIKRKKVLNIIVMFKSGFWFSTVVSIHS